MTATNSKTVSVSIVEGVMTICMSRPDARNSLNKEMMLALSDAFDIAAKNDHVRAVKLTGEGSVFCAGGDLKEIFQENTKPMDIKNLLDFYIRPIISKMLNLNKPIVTVLNGPAAGAGLGLVLASDMVVAHEKSSFITAFGQIGAMPDSGVMYLMVQNMGLMQAKNVVMRSQTLSAEQAKDLGLYTYVVAADKLEEFSHEILKELSSGPTVAIGFAKQALRDASRISFEAYMDADSLAMAVISTTDDKKEGVSAFKEKRRPLFKGH